MTGPCFVDANVLVYAREIEQRWRLSWWDAMIFAAAQLRERSLLLTEDLQDGAIIGDIAGSISALTCSGD